MAIRDRMALAASHPHDFTLQYPPRREYFQERFQTPVDEAALLAAAPAETLLYAHIPFCEAKCFYCNFAVDVRADPAIHTGYVEALETQLARMNAALDPAVKVPGVDIGGGTPTLLSPPLLERALAAIAAWAPRFTRPDVLSIETTPRIAATSPERLAVLKAGGVSRVSMGVQSTNDTHLETVNRSAQRGMAEAAMQNLRDAGFARLNVDLIFALPGQTEAQWRQDLAAAVALGVDSITTYDCLYRGKGRALTKRHPDMPSPEVYGRLYDIAYEELGKAGFRAPYGSVNFSRHNGETGTSPYFEGRLLDSLPYLGAGNYSSSLVGNNWWFAPYSVAAWSRAVMEDGKILPAGDGYALPPRETMAKQALLSLSFGILDEARFRQAFGVELRDVYGPELQFAEQRGLLQKKPWGWGVAEGRFADMAVIRSLFYTDDAAAWLGAAGPGVGAGLRRGRTIPLTVLPK